MPKPTKEQIELLEKWPKIDGWIQELLKAQSAVTEERVRREERQRAVDIIESWLPKGGYPRSKEILCRAQKEILSNNQD